MTLISGKDAPLAKVASPSRRWQVMTRPAMSQDQPVPLALTKVGPTGTSSLTTKGPTAVSGPLFVTSKFQSNELPATTGPVCVFTICTSALSMCAFAVSESV